MGMDITDMRKNPTANQRRIVELKKQQKEILKEQKKAAHEWNDELLGRNKTQTSNIRRQMVAVFLSGQPGTIDYRTTPPDLTQATDYKKRVSQLEQFQKTIDGITHEIKRLEQEEYKINLRSAKETKLGNVYDWYKNYGEPKRIPDKFEKFLSYVKPPSKKVRGAQSKDGTVKFPATISQALPVRKGTLTD